MASSSRRSRPWVVFSRIAALDDAVDDGGGDDVDFVTLPAPRVSRVTTIRRRLLMEPMTYREHDNPSVLAVDPSGNLLLIQVILRRATGSLPVVVDIPGRHRYLRQTGFACSYIVVDKATKTAYRLPHPGALEQPSSIGILYSPFGAGRYVVVELKFRDEVRDKAFLLCFRSDVGQWVTKDAKFQFQIPHGRRFKPHRVLSHNSRLWWVDLSHGLLTCDPFEVRPVLSFVELPHTSVWTSDLDKHRCVSVNDGSLCFVNIDGNNIDSHGIRKVSVYLLQTDRQWSLQYEVTFQTIWEHKSYKTARLSKIIPFLAFIHPIELVVYFYMKANMKLFGINMRERIPVVAECDDHQPITSSSVSSQFFHAWADSKPETRAGIVSVHPDILQRLYTDRIFVGLYGQLLDKRSGNAIPVEAINAYSKGNGQTIACASRALNNWNNSHSTTYQVAMSEHMDSNAFEGNSRFDVMQCFFHTNFCGQTSGGEKQYFFAELTGETGPDNIKTLASLGQDENEVAGNSEEGTCICCTGLMHPHSTSFIGGP